MTNVGTTIDDLNEFLAEYHLVGAGLRREGEKRSGNSARHWKWEGIYPALIQSGKVVTVGPGAMAGMRTIAGVEGYNSHMWMDYQILMPGERTQAHRTMRSETRLVWQAPPGAVFVCENEAYPMVRGDVVITPSWTFHDHFNEGNEPAIWIDAFDSTSNGGSGASRRSPRTPARPWSPHSRSPGTWYGMPWLIAAGAGCNGRVPPSRAALRWRSGSHRAGTHPAVPRALGSHLRAVS